jgi:hypothetical protein
MKTALKKAGLPALALRAALMLLVFGTLLGCPKEEDEDDVADVPVETGRLHSAVLRRIRPMPFPFTPHWA